MGVVDGVGAATLAGVVAGIGVAMPLGPIGVLLLQLAISAGWRAATAGALGVALVDLGYAGVAVLAGTAVTGLLAGHELGVQVAGALVLVGVVVRGLAGLRRELQIVRPQPSELSGSGTSAAGTLGRFVGLTAVNPLTAVYFVALSAGYRAALHGPQCTAGFVVGVFVASLSWQLLLVGAGATAARRLGARARLGTGVLGYLVVLGYAVRLAVGGG